MREVRRFRALVVDFEGERKADGTRQSGQVLIDLLLIEMADDPEKLIATEIEAFTEATK